MNTPSPSPRMRPEQDARVWDSISQRIQPRRKRHWRPIVISFAVVAAVLGSAAAWVVIAPPKVAEHQVWCYESASTKSGYTVGFNFPNSTPDKNGAIAKQECQQLWAAGGVGAGQTPDGQSTHSVPPLVVCRAPNGTYAVFPTTGDVVASREKSEKFCDRLSGGLAFPS